MGRMPESPREKFLAYCWIAWEYAIWKASEGLTFLKVIFHVLIHYNYYRTLYFDFCEDQEKVKSVVDFLDGRGKAELPKAMSNRDVDRKIYTVENDKVLQESRARFDLDDFNPHEKFKI